MFRTSSFICIFAGLLTNLHSMAMQQQMPDFTQMSQTQIMQYLQAAHLTTDIQQRVQLFPLKQQEQILKNAQLHQKVSLFPLKAELIKAKTEQLKMQTNKIQTEKNLYLTEGLCKIAEYELSQAKYNFLTACIGGVVGIGMGVTFAHFVVPDNMKGYATFAGVILGWKVGRVSVENIFEIHQDFKLLKELLAKEHNTQNDNLDHPTLEDMLSFMTAMNHQIHMHNIAQNDDTSLQEE